MPIPTPIASFQAEWEKIRQYDLRNYASHMLWARECRKPGHTFNVADKEAAIERQRIHLEAAGVISSEAERMARESVAEVTRGFVSHSAIEMVHWKGQRKALIRSSWPDREKRTIYFFDGTRAAQFDYQPAIGENRPYWIGTVCVDKHCALGFSASEGLDILLMRTPIQDVFPILRTQLLIENDIVQLETLRASIRVRLSICRQTCLPFQLEVFNEAEGFSSYVTTVNKWQSVNGVETPAEVVSYFADTGDVTENFDFKYTLEAAAFNNNVSPSVVLLPAGTRVNDWRFGEGEPVSYTLTDGTLPSDTQVRFWRFSANR